MSLCREGEWNASFHFIFHFLFHFLFPVNCEGGYEGKHHRGHKGGILGVKTIAHMGISIRTGLQSQCISSALFHGLPRKVTLMLWRTRPRTWKQLLGLSKGNGKENGNYYSISYSMLVLNFRKRTNPINPDMLF